MLKFTIRLDLEKDLKNRRDWANKISHGKDRTQNLSPQYKEQTDQLKGKNITECTFFKETLNKLYEEKEKQITYFEGEIKRFITIHPTIIPDILYKTTGEKLHIDHITLNLTTFPRCPYNITTNEIRIYVFDHPKNIIGILLHELQHFIVIHYFRNKFPLNKLNDEEFEFIKESLTVILNDYYPQYLWEKDNGYLQHQELRGLLYKKRKQEQNFQLLIEEAYKFIKNKKEVDFI